MTRLQVVIGKFLGCWLAAGLTVVVFYLFFGVVAATREHTFPAAQYLQAAWLHWMALGIVIAMTILGSVVLSAPSVNVTISFIGVGGILMLGGHLNKVAARMTQPLQTILSGIYYLLPHLEWAYSYRDRVLYGKPIVAWSAIAGASVYSLAYMGAFLIAAWLVFRRKTLTLG